MMNHISWAKQILGYCLFAYMNTFKNAKCRSIQQINNFNVKKGHDRSLQHFHFTTTPIIRCVMQNNRFRWQPERFSGRGKPRRCPIITQRFCFQKATAKVKT